MYMHDINADYNENENLYYLQVSGSFGRNRAMSAFNALLTEEHFKPGTNRIWDFRQADLEIYGPEIRTMAHLVNSTDKLHGRRFTSLLVRDSFQFGMWRMFQGSRDESVTKHLVTYDQEDAVAWASSDGMRATTGKPGLN